MRAPVVPLAPTFLAGAPAQSRASPDLQHRGRVLEQVDGRVPEGDRPRRKSDDPRLYTSACSTRRAWIRLRRIRGRLRPNCRGWARCSCSSASSHSSDWAVLSLGDLATRFRSCGEYVVEAGWDLGSSSDSIRFLPCLVQVCQTLDRGQVDSTQAYRWGRAGGRGRRQPRACERAAFASVGG